MWKFNLTSTVWEHIDGSQKPNMLAEFNGSYPYPGGVSAHSMVLDSTRNRLFLFGGEGFDDTTITKGT